MAQSIPTELGTEKIGKLLKQYAIPAIIAMTASSLYNMVDSIFIGHGVGAYAIAGLAITFPLMNLGAAFGSLVGVGASSLISMLLGEKNYGMAQKVFGNVITLNLIIGLLYTVAVLLFLDPILIFFGGSEQTLPYAREYMVIILWGNMITHMYFGLNAVLRAAGFPKRAMYATIFTVVLNTVLDPVFIYIFDMGISGAAIATVIAQVAAAALVIMSLHRSEDALRFRFKELHLDLSIAKNIFLIGFPAAIESVLYTISNLVIATKINDFGVDVIAANTAYGKIDAIFWMTLQAFSISITTFVGQNFGAGRLDRVKKGINRWFGISMLTSVIFSILMCVFSAPLLAIFNSDPGVIAIGQNIVLWIAPFWFTYVPIELISGSLRGMGNTLVPTVVTAVGIIGLRLGWIFLMPDLDLHLIFMVYPVTWSVTSLILLVYYYSGLYQKNTINLVSK